MAQLLRGRSGAITLGLVGYLFFVEFVSGVLQGYYIPLIPDLVEYLGIRDPDFNWFEAAQLLLSALVVPILAKLGDMIGHKKVLLLSTVLTAGASWWLVSSPCRKARACGACGITPGGSMPSTTSCWSSRSEAWCGSGAATGSIGCATWCHGWPVVCAGCSPAARPADCVTMPFP